MLPFYGHRAFFARSAFIAIIDTYAAFKIPKCNRYNTLILRISEILYSSFKINWFKAIYNLPVSFTSNQASDEKNELKIYRKYMENLWMKDFIVLFLSLYARIVWMDYYG